MTKIRSSAQPALPPPEEDSEDPRPISERAMRKRASHYLDVLNKEQREAVETLDGPLLVLAGAGTGKTRVLTTRIAHILSLGRARPSEILAVTFTNKAAREMKARVAELIGGVVEGMPWLGTFHAIGVKILRRHAELVDLKPSFTVLDTDDQIRLIKQLLEAENIDEKRWPARLLAAMIDGWKNRGLTPKRVPEGESFAFANGRARDLYALYQRRLKELNAADFGDLLLENLRLFQEHQDVLEKYQQRFRYMLVDEYQDSNVAQYLWLRLLAQGNGNICCVGDDDQSIYGWRGAEVDNILQIRDRLSRREDHQARAELSLDGPYPRRGVGPDRSQQRPPRQDTSYRWRCRREGHRRGLLGRRGRSEAHRRGHRAAPAPRPLLERDRHSRPRLVPDARFRGSLHHARPPLSRHRRPALL